MQIFNTLTRQKEEFVPQVRASTASTSAARFAYNFIHIGNAPPADFIVFDNFIAVIWATAATR